MGRTQVDLSIAARVCTCVHPLTPMVAVCSHVQACVHTHTESLFHKAETQSGAVAGGKSGGKDSLGVCRGCVHAATFNMGKTYCVVGEPCSGSRGSPDGSGVWGRGMRGCAWLSPVLSA